MHVKTTIEKCVVWMGNYDVTDMKYDVITYTPYHGPYYTV